MALRNRQKMVMLPMQVWDLPVRLFHWLLLPLLPAAYLTMKGGYPAVHLIIGYVLLALVLFRVLWGLFGSDTARFAQFLRRPAAAVHHLRRLTVAEPDNEVGHNAAGGWMVLFMLLLLLVQAVTGLFAHHKGGPDGPLAKFLGDTAAGLVTNVHGANFKLIFFAAAGHVAVVAVYLFIKKQNLIRPMVTGKKRLPAATRAPRLRSRLLALLLLIVAGVVSATLATQF